MRASKLASELHYAGNRRSRANGSLFASAGYEKKLAENSGRVPDDLKKPTGCC
jgi:hypothetical protein